METAARQTEQPEPILFRPDPPVRILVQTLTHLVPGSDGLNKTMFIINRICQLHWQCDYNYKEHRWSAYNDRFAFKNRRCFFLLDTGKSSNDDDVPILSYEWAGESLNPMPQLAQDPKILAKLKESFPFTWQPSEQKKRPRREIVKERLYCDSGLSDIDLNHVRDHPEDREWLRTHLRPRFWQKLVSEVNYWKPHYDVPDIE